MSKAYIPKALRRRVAEQGQYRCGYCLMQQRVVGVEMDVDHIFPEALGGPTEEENLWLACARCNEYKGDLIEAPDPLTGNMAPLFNPRTQHWSAHFAWNAEGTHVSGLTPTGRATVAALKLNRSPLVEARQVWVIAGVHPPKE